MAKTHLILKLALCTVSALSVTACGTYFNEYPTKDPRDVGARMEALSREVSEGLATKPASSRKTFGDLCGEDWQEEEKVSPLDQDPWKIDHSRFKFRSDFTILLQSGTKASDIYTTLTGHLNKLGGWKVENQNQNGLAVGVSGTKDEIRLDAFQTPDGNGGTKVYIELQSECYEHPNA
ncbi:hypothetical protein [Actinomadura rifamycini]|uniref:hypothetical protein n=1 Tax=Actinomadura rifamycini TaxID=31962 RepID=UPI0012FCF006|nr:hypothetical protein [Actinomadura rifamycini]